MRPAVLPPASEGALASAGEACGAALATCWGGAAARAVPAEPGLAGPTAVVLAGAAVAGPAGGTGGEGAAPALSAGVVASGVGNSPELSRGLAAVPALAAPASAATGFAGAVEALASASAVPCGDGICKLGGTAATRSGRLRSSVDR